MNHQTARHCHVFASGRGSLWLLLFIMILMFSCKQKTTRHYGFITLLGNDTISVESITKQGNSFKSDEVDRFPRVRVRHTVIDLYPNGSIKHLVMDIHTPSEPAKQRDRKVVADVTDSAVHLSKTDGTGTLKYNFPTGGALVVAHVEQMYSLYELYFAAAMKYRAASKTEAGNTVPLRQFYIDREFDHFPLGHATVRLSEDGRAAVNHDWLSGTGNAIMDSSFDMLSYSGANTTYKVEVRRLSSSPDVKSIASRFEDIEAKSGPVKALSVRDTVSAKIGDASFTIDYSRPLLRGRKLLGDVIPYERVWRTGANAATQFTLSAPIKLAGIAVPAGTYTLWTLPHPKGADLIVNKQSGQWGTEYNSSFNLGTAKMDSQQLSSPVEEFTMSIVPVDKQRGTLVIEWGSFRWTAPIEVK